MQLSFHDSVMVGATHPHGFNPPPNLMITVSAIQDCTVIPVGWVGDADS